jgi:transposase, IS30 family
MKYKHLSIEEREKIQELLWQKTSIRDIAKVIGRSTSSISRELKRNKPKICNRYTPRLANEKAIEKRKSRGRKLRLKNYFIRRYVVDHLKKGYSPEQIAGRLKLEYPNQKISHEAIYQYIYSQAWREGHAGTMKPGYRDLRVYLKRRHKRRIAKGMGRGQRIFKHKGISIELRPKEVERRKTLGHWEGDSIVSMKSTVGLNTLVERKTGLVLISKIKNKTMEETSNIVINRLKDIPCKTLTLDNGTENFGYENIQEKLQISCYFAHPYCSGERGTNENTNGLIRWYFPKGTDFATIGEEAIQAVEWALNNRPRKRLGWKTPLEAFNESVAVTG